MDTKKNLFLVIVGAALLIAVAVESSVVRKRSVSENSLTDNLKDLNELSTESPASPDVVDNCSDVSACAWAVYNRDDKQIEYHLKNKMCKCVDGLSCVQCEDNVSSGTYIFYCRNTTIHSKDISNLNLDFL